MIKFNKGIVWTTESLIQQIGGMRVVDQNSLNLRLWCNGSMMDSKPIGQGSKPCGRAKI